MRILLASHTAPGGVFRVGSHHLARELSALGHQVCHLSSPVSAAHVLHLRDHEVRRRFRLAARSIRSNRAAGDLLPLTVLPLSMGPRLSSDIALRTALPGIGRSLIGLGFAKVNALVIDQPLLAGLDRYVDADRIVYRSTDFVETPAKLAGEARILDLADGLIGTSQPVLDGLLQVRPDLPALLLENGVEFDHFHHQVRDAGNGQPIPRRSGAVYVGAIDDRFNWTALTAMALANPDVPIEVWGPVQTTTEAALPPNIHLRGPAEYAEVPDLLAQARVGLMPFKHNALNRGRSAMKLYEYLAAGLNVVTTMPSNSPRPIPGQWVIDEQRPGDALRVAHETGTNTAGIEFARTMDWSTRATQLVDFVRDLPPGRLCARSGVADDH